jgi:hypothetical protein
MQSSFMDGFNDELEKLALIFGAQEPEHPFSPSQNIPYKEREKDYMRYARVKSSEEPTPWWKALLGGGAAGGGLGGLAGAGVAADHRAKGKGMVLAGLIGAGIGAGLGALVGAGVRGADVAEIEHTKRMTRDREGRKYYINAGIGSREGWERESDREARVEAGRETGRAIGEGIRESKGAQKKVIVGALAKK